MYVVTTPNTEATFANRTEAVRAARDKSERMRSPVKVLRKDGWERLVYRRGSLQESRLVTHDRRRRADRLS